MDVGVGYVGGGLGGKQSSTTMWGQGKSLCPSSHCPGAATGGCHAGLGRRAAEVQLLRGRAGSQSQPGGPAKWPWGGRENPPPHSQLFTPMKSPGSDQKKRQRRRRGARRGRRRQAVVEINPEPEQELDPEPSSQEEAEPEHPESAPPEPVHQEQSPMLTTQDMVGGMQLGVVERELADRSQDPAGEVPQS